MVSNIWVPYLTDDFLSRVKVFNYKTFGAGIALLPWSYVKCEEKVLEELCRYFGEGAVGLIF